ncbi:hypothetical protein J0910_31235 [Nocardiopsis sp. CNT-189]|uniref:hypothetical protein n=1 Tax=Nocardiopsis oceanisediminis TaxID=2816862 RepID=UPI003B33450E
MLPGVLPGVLPADKEEPESECSWYQANCHIKEDAKEFLVNSLSESLQSIAEAINEAVGQAVTGLGTLWVYMPTTDLIRSGESDRPVQPQPPHKSSVWLETVLEWTVWVSLGICVLSLMAAGAMMALRARRGEGGEHLRTILTILVASVIIASSSGIVRGLMASGPSAMASGPVRLVQQHLWWYIGAAVVLSVVVAGARMAWEQRAAPGKDLIKSLLLFAVVSGAGVYAISGFIQASDGFAKWLVADGSTNDDFGNRVLTMLGLATGAQPAFGVMLVITLGSIAMLLSLVQIMLMIIRDGMLVMLTAVLPLAAAFTNTEMGQSWFKKACGWLIAFLLYKPAAAIVYAIAFTMVGEGNKVAPTLHNVVTGLALMLVALVALPALMKFVVPMASLGGGGAAVGAMAGVAAAGFGKAGEMASGAISTGKGVGESEASLDDGGGGGPASGAPTSPDQGGQDQQGDAPAEQQGGGLSEDPEGADDPSDTGTGDGGTDPTGARTEGEGPADTGTGSEAPTGTGGAEAGGAAASGAAAAGAAPWIEAAEAVKEAGDAVKAGAEGTAREATEGPDGSN